MSIPIPISKKYTATSRQGTLKEVACEECSHEYAYEMIRSAQGSSSTFVFIPGEGTKNLAADRAHQKASKMLEKQCDPVPCPECGHVQAQMIPHYRRQQLAGMRVFAYLLMGLAFILMWVHFVMLLFRDLDQRDLLGGGLMPHPTVWYVLAGIVAAGFLLLGARIVLSSGYDPNRSGNVRKLKEEGAARAIDLAKLRRKLETEELKRRIKSQVPKG